MIINEKAENLSREIKVIKKNLKEILQIKNIKFKNYWIELKNETMYLKKDQYRWLNLKNRKKKDFLNK